MINRHGRAIAAATDGACSGNPGPGGWGALIHFEDGCIEELGGFEPKTTNNRMELKAGLEVLKKLRDLERHPNLKIKTDSKYLIDGFENWMTGWKKKGWKKSNGKQVLNEDLWKELDNSRLLDVSFQYVKGHNGDPDNERVDYIAVCFSKKIAIKLQCDYDKQQNGK
ncbi:MULTISPECIES: ribonuclease H family protein [unclassified Prochlorococcus]|uniref:ribonuclease H family protein n=1 Tax=unclassified Prochlorococcus TaxID=2627481 RepID=UPI000533776C|nr:MULTISPECIES: ribonuclease H [unclassified Prochlorococcus]KGG16737.1 Ribonuclease HI [Prochlorococcus sp. MIT 0602]KGG18290.1 Ribonuclease HI [Prochlorococcus sp. MIT 0603]